MPNDRDTKRRNKPDTGSSEFFVGYLKTPPRVARFSIVVIGAFLVVMIAGGASLALLQRAPGEGLQRARGGVELTGFVRAEPYPILRDLDPETGEVRHTLLVRSGKFGGPAIKPEWQGKVLTARGLLLGRDGVRMLETYRLVEAAPEAALVQRALEQKLEQLRAASTKTAPQPYSATGEIVDSKCHLGRMKPGYGQAHRACAQYCVRSGIPPIFQVPQADGPDRLFLLTDSAGQGLKEAVIPYLAERVRVSGYAKQLGENLWLLAIDPQAVDAIERVSR